MTGANVLHPDALPEVVRIHSTFQESSDQSMNSSYHTFTGRFKLKCQKSLIQ